MAISRRKFAQKAGLIIVGAGFAGSAGKIFSQSLSPGNFADPVMDLKSEAFLPYIGTLFSTVRNGHLRNSLQLTEIILHQDPKEKPAEINGESFSLLFRNISGKKLPEEIHTFEHPWLGTFSLFIAPVERAKTTYEAVINHL